MQVLGLTGSIGMGKSTALRLFAEAGLPCHDADAVVAALYADGRAAKLLAPYFPSVVCGDKIDRAALAEIVFQDKAALQRLESLLHPLVAQARAAFLQEQKRQNQAAIVLDIPLLLETNQAEQVDVIIVVSAPQHVQEERVLARPGMTKTRLQAIRARQMPDAEKCRHADFVVDGAASLVDMRGQIHAILATLGIELPDGQEPDKQRPDKHKVRSENGDSA